MPKYHCVDKIYVVIFILNIKNWRFFCVKVVAIIIFLYREKVYLLLLIILASMEYCGCVNSLLRVLVAESSRRYYGDGSNRGGKKMVALPDSIPF